MSLVMCSGFDENLYSSARIEGDIDRNTHIITLKKGDLALHLDSIVERASTLEDDLLDGEQRYVIFIGSRSGLDSVMKGFKKAYKPSVGSVIYAMLTDTAKQWTLQKYLEELAQEHEEMRKYQAQSIAPPTLHEQQAQQGSSATGPDQQPDS